MVYPATNNPLTSVSDRITEKGLKVKYMVGGPGLEPGTSCL